MPRTMMRIEPRHLLLSTVVPLAIGPAFGVLAMARLRARPEAARLAGGHR